MRTYIKIKIMSLAAETRIIRKEEKKFKSKRWNRRTGEWERQTVTETGAAIRLGLYEHRKNDVASEARSALIAYGYLKSYPYSKIEQPLAGNPANPNRIAQIVHKYGGNYGAKFNDVLKQIETWMESTGKVREKKLKISKKTVDIASIAA